MTNFGFVTATRMVGGAIRSVSAMTCLYTFMSNEVATAAERILAGGLYWKPYCTNSKIINRQQKASATTATSSSTLSIFVFCWRTRTPRGSLCVTLGVELDA